MREVIVCRWRQNEPASPSTHVSHAMDSELNIVVDELGEAPVGRASRRTQFYLVKML